MLTNRTTAVLILSSVIATACRTEPIQGFLTVGFVGEEPMTRTIIIPPPEDGEYEVHYVIEKDDRICVLTGRIPLENMLFSNFCDGLTGYGKLSCNDGRAMGLQWTLTSCEGGYGRSTEFAGSTFHLGFESTEKKARQQFENAQLEGKTPSPRRLLDVNPAHFRAPQRTP